jgi:hypothetical protein
MENQQFSNAAFSGIALIELNATELYGTTVYIGQNYSQRFHQSSQEETVLL